MNPISTTSFRGCGWQTALATKPVLVTNSPPSAPVSTSGGAFDRRRQRPAAGTLGWSNEVRLSGGVKLLCLKAKRAKKWGRASFDLLNTRSAQLPMKIGLFGNTNNSMFALAEGIRSLGHDVEFILTSKELLHRPESRVPELRAGYPDWIVDASDVEEW